MLGANGVNIKHTSYLLDNNDISKQRLHKAIKDDTLELSWYGDVPRFPSIAMRRTVK